jgi:hypothetical protein
VRVERLELDDVGSSGGGHFDQAVSEIDVTIVVYPGLSDDKSGGSRHGPR